MTALREFLAAAQQLETEGLALIASASSSSVLEQARTSLVGRKSGRLNDLLKSVPQLEPEDRREGGAAVNRVKTALETAIADRAHTVATEEKPQTAGVDFTLPSRQQFKGALHPVTLVIEEIIETFRTLGFTVAAGPEAETEWYNFTALNFPPDHPAMDAHDTIYLADDVVLRTHTSPVQIRTMQTHRPPLRVLIPGNVYRLDPFDASHAPMFAQIEGLCVDEGVSFVDLKATLSHFASKFFGATRMRFRPSYFPFTEPSAEMDVQCQLCKGAGCAGCKGSGWMEILGAGMVHPKVLEASGVDSERYTGWAFGMGPARIALQRYGIPDIRVLYDSDVRFLERVAR